ncbi:hypothetical protein HOLleu_00712 [Holothuria leucospilota]|uniref:Uncharacterized protein n=1 Tax=Holothuria leucospilota TaxID=206669 RepID=A0A9Q1CMK8_HOLLE|nr:hypothetical protein HOLleu_00712 [Holothuria leucospilota]
MWTSVVHHVCDIHTWNSGNLFHSCKHENLSQEARNQKMWLKPGSKAHEALKNVVFNKTLRRDLKQVTKACHTGHLEVFHSALLKYCPKRLHFNYPTNAGAGAREVVNDELKKSL